MMSHGQEWRSAKDKGSQAFGAKESDDGTQRQVEPKKDADGTEPGMPGNQGGTNLVMCSIAEDRLSQ